jgi:hypothetical protein
MQPAFAALYGIFDLRKWFPRRSNAQRFCAICFATLIFCDRIATVRQKGATSDTGQTEKKSVRANVSRSSPKADMPEETHWDVHSKSNIMRNGTCLRKNDAAAREGPKMTNL